VLDIMREKGGARRKTIGQPFARQKSPGEDDHERGAIAIPVIVYAWVRTLRVNPNAAKKRADGSGALQRAREISLNILASRATELRWENREPAISTGLRPTVVAHPSGI